MVLRLVVSDGGGCNVVARNMKDVGDRIVDGDETLNLAAQLEALHDPLTPSDRLVGFFRPIVRSFMRAMFDAGHDIVLRHHKIEACR